MWLNRNEWNTNICFDRTFTHGKTTVMHFKICLDLRLLVVLCFHWCFLASFWFLIYILICTYQLTRHIIYITFGPSTLSTNNSNAVSDGCFGFCIRLWNVLEILLHQASSKQLVAQWSKAYLSWQADGSKQKKKTYNFPFLLNYIQLAAARYWNSVSKPLVFTVAVSVQVCVLLYLKVHIQVNLFAPSPFFLFFNHFLINLSFLFRFSFFFYFSLSALFLSLIRSLLWKEPFSKVSVFRAGRREATQLDRHQSKTAN